MIGIREQCDEIGGKKVMGKLGLSQTSKPLRQVAPSLLGSWPQKLASKQCCAL